MIGDEKAKIRPIIVVLGLFVASMLYQTRSNRMGTLVAFALVATMILLIIMECKGKIYLGSLGILLVGFIAVTTVVTMFRSNIPSYYVKLIAQMIVFILLLGLKRVNEREERYLRTLFIVSSLFYATMGIVGSQSGGTRYYHGSIILFGTPIDPNFFGIPIVACATLLLYLLLTEKKNKILFAIGYFLLIITILFSSSRGTFVAVLIGNFLVILNFVLGRKIKLYKKTIAIIFMIAAVIFLYQVIQNNFDSAWNRFLSIGDEGSDNGRFNLWRNALNTWMKYPILGGGLYYNYLTNHAATHNTYLQVLSETGLVGFTIYAVMLCTMLKRTLKYNTIYGIILIAILVQIFFLDALDNRCFWSITCWFAVLPSEKRCKLVH